MDDRKTKRAVASLTDTLWERYRARGDSRARSQLLDCYLGLVHHGAREMVKRAPRALELDDLISAGTLGLVQALEGFDPSRGLAFSTYAMPRIRGSMLDELRSQDWMPRTIRARSRLIDRARGKLQMELGHKPSAQQIAEELGVELADYWRWHEEIDGRSMVALDPHGGSEAAGQRPLSETIADPGSGEASDAITRREMLVELREAFASLPVKERLVLALYYYENLNLKQIGEVIHVTESRVSQIRTRALVRLRDRAKKVEEER